MRRILGTLFVVLGLLAAGDGFGEEARTASFTVKGMTCEGCVSTIKSRLKKVDGLISYQVSLEKGEASATFDPSKTSEARIAEAITKAGYPTAAKPASAEQRSSEPVQRSPAPTRPARSEVSPANLAFFEVGLVCHAAPRIGCGSRAKPALRALEADARIAGAWLNEAGTRVAISWKEKALTARQLQVLLEGHDLPLVEIRGAKKKTLWKTFASPSAWYDSDSVDRLSEREAGIISARLVRRLKKLMPLSPAQESGLRSDWEKTLREKFTVGGGEINEAMLQVATRHLGKIDDDVLEKMKDLGYGPNPGEE